MKFVLVNITREATAKGTRMVYPSVYDAVEVEMGKRGPIVYEGRIGAGEASEKCLIYVSDTLAAKLDTHADCSIVTQTEADTWLDQNPMLQALPSERVTDPDRMQAIQAKVAASITPSQEDLDALDPDKSTRGINRTPKTASTIFKLS